jgi:hypothetical protein
LIGIEITPKELENLYNKGMNKEQALELLKHLILQLRDNSKTIQADPKLMHDWIAKFKHVEISIKELGPEDNRWLESEYSKFFQKEVRPFSTSTNPANRI